MKAQKQLVKEEVQRTMLKLRLINGIKVVSTVMGIIFILVLVLPLISAYGKVIHPLTATRFISSEKIAPGFTCGVKVKLAVNKDVKDFILDENIPSDWTVASVDNAGALFNLSERKWTWPSVSAGETKIVSYDVTAPLTAKEKSYPILGKIYASGIDHTSVGGEHSIAVTTPKISLLLTVIVIFIILVVFVGILVAGWYADRNLDKGEMRRAIAGIFVVGFTIIVFLSIGYDIELSKIVLMYIELAGIVIGYYFGAKTAKEKRAEVASKISIEHMKFVYDADPKKRKIILTIRNGGDTEIKVDKIYVNEVAHETSLNIESQKSKEIEELHEWKYETEYKIKIAATTGLTDEISRLSPKEKQK